MGVRDTPRRAARLSSRSGVCAACSSDWIRSAIWAARSMRSALGRAMPGIVLGTIPLQLAQAFRHGAPEPVDLGALDDERRRGDEAVSHAAHQHALVEAREMQRLRVVPG